MVVMMVGMVLMDHHGGDDGGDDNADLNLVARDDNSKSMPRVVGKTEGEGFHYHLLCFHHHHVTTAFTI